MKLLFMSLVLLLFLGVVFSLTPQQSAVNYLAGNPLKETVKLGTYDTNIILVKQKATDSFWYACFPLKGNVKYNFICSKYE